MRKLTQVSLWLTQWSERWMPSALSTALVLTLVIFLGGIFLGKSSLIECIRHWGDGFWLLLEFGMQMCLMLVSGYLLASSPIISRFLNFLTDLKRPPERLYWNGRLTAVGM